MAELHCWHDFGDATCMLVDGHDGDHEPTPDNEIVVTFTGESEKAADEDASQPPPEGTP